MKWTPVFFAFTIVASVAVSLVQARSQESHPTVSSLTVAQVVSTPSPAPKPTANPLTVNGYVRAFQFNRQNASAAAGGFNQINQQSMNFAVKLHGEYAFAHSPFAVGATYVQADLLDANGPCSHIPQYAPGGLCQQFPSSDLAFKESDTTLPAFPLSTLAEAYLQYKDKMFFAKVGTQSFNSSWAGPSDSRVKAAYYEGADVKAMLTGGWTLEAARMIQWENRTTSDFNKSTLLTVSSNGTFTPTSGFTLGNVAYAHGADFTGDAQFYQFSDIANMAWLEGKWYPNPKASAKPFIAFQFADESSNGKALVGTVRSQLWGLQLGVNTGKSISWTLGYDNVPVKSQLIVLPPGAGCSATTHLVSGGVGIFLPTGGTPNCVPGAVAGTATIYYGGVASPYSDSYTSDPAFTTSMSQGMIDRRSPGSSFKLAATIQTNDKRWKFILSRAGYDYSNPAGGNAMTWETDLDGTYFFNKVAKTGAYRGFSLRERYAERTIQNTGVFGGLPLFKYNRVQVEYDF